eukprot:4216241-Heterocapsa_arctica.AAC.1
MRNPCNCKAFLHAHFHTSGRHRDGERCPPEMSIPFLERILEVGTQKHAVDDAKAAEDEAKALDELWQCEETAKHNAQEI